MKLLHIHSQTLEGELEQKMSLKNIIFSKQTAVSALISLFITILGGFVVTLVSPEIRIALGLDQEQKPTLYLMATDGELKPGRSVKVLVNTDIPIDYDRLTCTVRTDHNIQGITAKLDGKCRFVIVSAPPMVLKDKNAKYISSPGKGLGKVYVNVQDNKGYLTNEYNAYVSVQTNLEAVLELSSYRLKPKETIQASYKVGNIVLPDGFRCTWDLDRGLHIHTKSSDKCDVEIYFDDLYVSDGDMRVRASMFDPYGNEIETDGITVQLFGTGHS